MSSSSSASTGSPRIPRQVRGEHVALARARPSRRARSRRCRRRPPRARAEREPLAARTTTGRLSGLEHALGAAWRAPPPRSAAHVDAADADALADLLGVGAVVRVDAPAPTRSSRPTTAAMTRARVRIGESDGVGDARRHGNPCNRDSAREAAWTFDRASADAELRTDARRACRHERRSSTAPPSRRAGLQTSLVARRRRARARPAAASSRTARSRRSATPTAGPARPRRPPWRAASRSR